MSLTDQLLGTSPSATTTSIPLMTADQQAALSKAIQDMMSSGVSKTAADTQNLSLSALEKQAMDTVSSNTKATDALNSIMASGGGITPGSNADASAALDSIIKSGGSPLDINSLFTNTVQQPMMKTFSDTILPSLQATFSGSSAFGSDKDKQREILTNNLTQNLTNARSNMSYQSSSDALSRLVTAIGLQPQINTADANMKNLGVQNVLKAAGMVPQVNADTTTALTNTSNAATTALQPLNQLLTQRTVQPTTVVTPGTQGVLGSLASALTAAMLSGKAGGLGSSIVSGIGSLLSGAGGVANSAITGLTNLLSGTGTNSDLQAILSDPNALQALGLSPNTMPEDLLTALGSPSIGGVSGAGGGMDMISSTVGGTDMNSLMTSLGLDSTSLSGGTGALATGAAATAGSSILPAFGGTSADTIAAAFSPATNAGGFLSVLGSGGGTLSTAASAAPAATGFVGGAGGTEGAIGGGSPASGGAGGMSSVLGPVGAFAAAATLFDPNFWSTATHYYTPGTPEWIAANKATADQIAGIQAYGDAWTPGMIAPTSPSAYVDLNTVGGAFGGGA